MTAAAEQDQGLGTAGAMGDSCSSGTGDCSNSGALGLVTGDCSSAGAGTGNRVRVPLPLLRYQQVAAAQCSKGTGD